MVIMTDVFGERVGSCRQAHPNNKCVRSSINDLEKMLADQNLIPQLHLLD